MTRRVAAIVLLASGFSWTSFNGGIGLDLRDGLGFGLALGGPNTGVPFDPYRQWTINLGLRYSRHNIVTEAFPQDRGCHVTPIL
jgi:hypothetical protein